MQRRQVCRLPGDLRLSIAARDGRSDSTGAITAGDGLRPSIAAATPVSELCALASAGITDVLERATLQDSTASDLVSSSSSSALARPSASGGTRDKAMLVSVG